MTSPLTRVSLGCHSRSRDISFCIPDSPWQLSRYAAQTPKSDFHSYLLRSAFLESSADFLCRLYIQSRTSPTGGVRQPSLPTHYVFNKYLGSPTLCLTPSGVKGILRQMTGTTMAHQKGRVNEQGSPEWQTGVCSVEGMKWGAIKRSKLSQLICGQHEDVKGILIAKDT